MKILVCFGTRPEAIKMAPVIHELKKQKLHFKICITAQHREMLDQVLDFFEIVPDYDLDLMTPDQSLNKLSAKILNEIDIILEQEFPTVVLVQGDTNTAAMVGLAAFHRNIKIGHIEAGLRTYDKTAPFPEEINRQLIARIADFHFAPTSKAKSNLVNEQVLKKNIYLTGNTVVDALEWAVEKLKSNLLTREILSLQNLLDPNKKLILVTGHRRESFGKGITELCAALLEISEIENVELIYPVHLNPRIAGPVKELLDDKKNIYLINPVTYPTMIWLLQRCRIVISDSGGVQEEAPAFNKPVVVTREVTERIESLNAGYSFLTGTDKNKILTEVKRLLNDPPDFSKMENPYGDGTAANSIVEILKNKFG